MRNLVLGLVIGIGVGWVVFHEHEPVAPRTSGDRPSPPEAASGNTPRMDGPPATTPPVARVDAAWVRVASGRALGLKSYELRQGKAKTNAGSVTAAIARIDQVRRARDWTVFVGLVQFLAATRDPDAQAKLVALMGDTSIRFHDWRIAEHFRKGLESNVPGAVEAATRRIAFEFDAYEDRNRYTGWLEIIARHGEQGDLEWMAATTRARDRNALARALAKGAANPPAARMLIETLKQNTRLWSEDDIARAFGKQNPEAAREFYGSRFEAWKPQAGLRSRYPGDLGKTARAYGLSITAESLPQAKAFLNGLGDPSQRIAAAYAISSLKRNGLDITGLEPVLLAPVEEAERLARATPEERKKAGPRPRYTIEYNRVTWSARAADALDALADATKDRGEAEALRGVAKTIRAKLGLGGATWVTSD